MTLLVCANALSCLAGPPVKIKAPNYGYFDFPTCVRYALAHSDEFLQNRLEIQTASLDLKDAHSKLLPALSVTTRYYLSRADDVENDSSDDINVEISISNWNPYAALLEIKSKSIVVDLARTAHKQKVASGVADIAKLFYQISQVQKTIRSRKQIAAFRNNNYEYGVSKREQGSIDASQVRLWRNSLLGEKLTIQELQSTLRSQVAALKQKIGYHPDYYLPLDTRDAESQILGGFKGCGINFNTVQALNYDLKLLAKQEQLQSTIVTAAYVALVPQPTLVMEDLTNQQDRASGFNLAFGLNYMIWDGFRRVREIKRQKLEARKMAIDRKKLSEALYGEYRRLLDTIRLSESKSRYIWEQVNLAEMAEEKVFSQYKSGNAPYEKYMDARINKVSSLISAYTDRGKKVEALLDLATMAGGLNKYNARIRF